MPGRIILKKFLTFCELYDILNLQKRKGNKNMIIVKKEVLKLSARECEHLEMAFMLMETIANNATCPDLIHLSGQAVMSLRDILDDYVEVEEEV